EAAAARSRSALSAGPTRIWRRSSLVVDMYLQWQYISELSSYPRARITRRRPVDGSHVLRRRRWLVARVGEATCSWRTGGLSRSRRGGLSRKNQRGGHGSFRPR